MQVPSENNKATSTCFSLFIGGQTEHTTHLLTDNTSLLAPSGEDCMDTCSFYSGPSESTIIAFGESSEAAGTIAFGEGCESAGTIAFSGGGCESAGTIASSSASCGSSSSCGCSYSC